LDETVTLGRIEPLHCAAWHVFAHLRMKCEGWIGWGVIGKIECDAAGTSASQPRFRKSSKQI
jgi:hypothetical protein